MKRNDLIKYALCLVIVISLALLFAAYEAYFGGRAIPADKKMENDVIECFAAENTGNAEDEFHALKKSVDEKYLEKFCDIFEDAKIKLQNESLKILGKEYEALLDRIKLLRDEIIETRKTVSESEEAEALKDELAELKEKLIEAESENKPAVRKELDEVLKEITRRNLEAFNLMSQKKRELNALKAEAFKIAFAKEKELKSAESELLVSVKYAVGDLAASYAEEVKALSQTFNVSVGLELPFLKALNLDMRISDFDKQAFTSFYKGEKRGGCIHDCRSCKEACGKKPFEE